MIESQYGDKTFPSFVKWLVGWRVGCPHSTSSAKEAHEAHRELTKTCVRTLTKIRRWPVPWTLIGTSCNRGCFYTALCYLPFSLHFVFDIHCSRCFYCALNYRVIAKFETFQQDLRLIVLIFQELRLNMSVPGTLDTPPMWPSTRACRKTGQEKELPQGHLASSSRYPPLMQSDISQFVPPAEPKRSRCPVQPLQRGLPHVWILNIALSCSCSAIKIGFENT